MKALNFFDMDFDTQDDEESSISGTNNAAGKLALFGGGKVHCYSASMYAYMHVCRYIYCIHLFIHTFVCMYVCMYGLYLRIFKVYVCMYVCMYVCKYGIYIIHIHVCMYICMYVCMNL